MRAIACCAWAICWLLEHFLHGAGWCVRLGVDGGEGCCLLVGMGLASCYDWVLRLAGWPCCFGNFRPAEIFGARESATRRPVPERPAPQAFSSVLCCCALDVFPVPGRAPIGFQGIPLRLPVRPPAAESPHLTVFPVGKEIPLRKIVMTVALGVENCRPEAVTCAVGPPGEVVRSGVFFSRNVLADDMYALFVECHQRRHNQLIDRPVLGALPPCVHGARCVRLEHQLHPRGDLGGQIQDGIFRCLGFLVRDVCLCFRWGPMLGACRNFPVVVLQGRPPCPVRRIRLQPPLLGVAGPEYPGAGVFQSVGESGKKLGEKWVPALGCAFGPGGCQWNGHVSLVVPGSLPRNLHDLLGQPEHGSVPLGEVQGHARQARQMFRRENLAAGLLFGCMQGLADFVREGGDRVLSQVDVVAHIGDRLGRLGGTFLRIQLDPQVRQQTDCLQGFLDTIFRGCS